MNNTANSQPTTNCKHTNTKDHQIGDRIYTNCVNCGTCVGARDAK